MKNFEKYKTAEERAKAHEEYCDKHNCRDCPCDFTQEDEDNGSTEWRLCAFRWLELDAEKKIEPCPFCGSDCEEDDSGEFYFVRCVDHDCDYCSGNSLTIEDAIAAHNRVARAVRAAKEGAEK